MYHSASCPQTSFKAGGCWKGLLPAVRQSGASLSPSFTTERRDVLQDELYYWISHINVCRPARGDTVDLCGPSCCLGRVFFYLLVVLQSADSVVVIHSVTLTCSQSALAPKDNFGEFFSVSANKDTRIDIDTGRYREFRLLINYLMTQNMIMEYLQCVE